MGRLVLGLRGSSGRAHVGAVQYRCGLLAMRPIEGGLGWDMRANQRAPLETRTPAVS